MFAAGDGSRPRSLGPTETPSIASMAASCQLDPKMRRSRCDEPFDPDPPEQQRARADRLRAATSSAPMSCLRAIDTRRTRCLPRSCIGSVQLVHHRPRRSARASDVEFGDHSTEPNQVGLRRRRIAGRRDAQRDARRSTGGLSARGSGRRTAPVAATIDAGPPASGIGPCRAVFGGSVEGRRRVSGTPGRSTRGRATTSAGWSWTGSPSGPAGRARAASATRRTSSWAASAAST